MIRFEVFDKLTVKLIDKYKRTCLRDFNINYSYIYMCVLFILKYTIFYILIHFKLFVISK